MTVNPYSPSFGSLDTTGPSRRARKPSSLGSTKPNCSGHLDTTADWSSDPSTGHGFTTFQGASQALPLPPTPTSPTFFELQSLNQAPRDAALRRYSVAACSPISNSMSWSLGLPDLNSTSAPDFSSQYSRKSSIDSQPQQIELRNLDDISLPPAGTTAGPRTNKRRSKRQQSLDPASPLASAPAYPDLKRRKSHQKLPILPGSTLNRGQGLLGKPSHGTKEHSRTLDSSPFPTLVPSSAYPYPDFNVPRHVPVPSGYPGYQANSQLNLDGFDTSSRYMRGSKAARDARLSKAPPPPGDLRSLGRAHHLSDWEVAERMHQARFQPRDRPPTGRVEGGVEPTSPQRRRLVSGHSSLSSTSLPCYTASRLSFTDVSYDQGRSFA